MWFEEKPTTNWWLMSRSTREVHGMEITKEQVLAMAQQA
jgi:hypothetical protein